MRTLQVTPLPGYDPEVGRWLWALQEVTDAQGHLTRVLGVPLTAHLERLQRSREIFPEEFRRIPVEEWRRLRRPPDDVDYEVMPEWAVFHLVEHAAGHAFQISALKARGMRLLAQGPLQS